MLKQFHIYKPAELVLKLYR